MNNNGTYINTTEADAEKAARARVDRLNEIRRAYAEKHGIHPGSVHLTRADFDRVDAEMGGKPAEIGLIASDGKPPTKSQAILDACKKLADADGVVDRDALFTDLGYLDPASRRQASALIENLKYRGVFPYTIPSGRPGKKPGVPAPRPKPSTVVAVIETPEIVPAIEPDPMPSASVVLAESIAEIDRVLDNMTDEERQFIVEYIRHRF